MKPTLNKWQFSFYFGRDYRTMDRGWKIFHIGYFKIIEMPGQGAIMQPEQYKGFILKFAVWLPIDSA